MSHLPDYHQSGRPKVPAISHGYLKTPQDSNESIEEPSEINRRDWTISAESKPLRNHGIKATSCIVDGVCLLLCVAIFAFAVLIYRADNTIMESYQWKLINTAKIGTTAFPYIFALIISRSLQTLLRWRLGRGIDALSFAYLSKSSTLSSTFISPLQLLAVHWLPLGLAALWTLSPFGSQAMLRFVAVNQLSIPSNSTNPVQYFYPAANSELTSDDLPGVNSANAILQASLVSVGTSLYEPQDVFGNLKVPEIRSLNNSDDTNDWTMLPSQGNVTYSSLVGIPFRKPPGKGNMTFNMLSWYWTLENLTISEYNATGMDSPYAYGVLPAAPSGWANATSTDYCWQILLPDSNNVPSASTPLVFEEDPGVTAIITRLSATLLHQPVELQATCDTANCQATAVRPADFPVVYNSQFDFQFFKGFFTNYLTTAFPLSHQAVAEPTAFEAYLGDSSQDAFDPNSPGYNVNPYDLGADVLALRLEQIFNTFWIALSAGSLVTGFGAVNTSQLLQVGSQLNTTYSLNATATFYNWTDYLQCNKAWLAVLCLATVIMFSATVVSIVFTILYDGPAATDFLSALTRSYGLPPLEHGSYLSGDNVTRRLKGVELKIGDSRPDKTVGRIVIGPSELLGDLERNRYYA